MSPPPTPGTSEPAAARIRSSVIRDLLALTEQPGVISLAGGQPSPATFPVDEVRAATDTVLAREGTTALQYSATEGIRPLREWVAAQRGVDTDRITITSGSQQGLDLVARALIAPGDIIACADPGYVGALQVFRLADAALVGIPADGQGLRVDVLAERLAAGLRPRLVYLIPELSNPSGATIAADRWSALAELADRYDFRLVEDDPYAALRWRGDGPPPLATYSDRVISLGTVSKVLSPGLRIGHVVAPDEITARIVRVKQAADLHTSTLTQHIVHELVNRPGFLDHHLATLPGHYRERAEALTVALHRHLGDRVSFEEPDGGMFVWARLLPERSGLETPDAARLLEHAVDGGMAFVPGNAFGVTEGQDHHADRLRLSFATPSPAEITEAVHRLATALDTYTRSTRAA